jgi:hypothetical protein
MNAIEAKEFLACRIVDQARLENVEFSEVERKMLFYSEVHPSLPDMDAAAKEFDEKYNMFPYEKLVSSLVCNAYRRDRKDPTLAQKWKDASRSLRWEDHYINVMLKRGMASATRTRDLLIYVALGVLVVVVIFAVVALGH